MSNVLENELKNAKNDLKISVEKLESELKELKDRYHGTIWDSHSLEMATMKRDLMDWELARQKRELAIFDYLIEISMSMPITFEVSGDIPDRYSGFP